MILFLCYVNNSTYSSSPSHITLWYINDSKYTSSVQISLLSSTSLDSSLYKAISSSYYNMHLKDSKRHFKHLLFLETTSSKQMTNIYSFSSLKKVWLEEKKLLTSWPFYGGQRKSWTFMTKPLTEPTSKEIIISLEISKRKNRCQIEDRENWNYNINICLDFWTLSNCTY